MASFTQFGNDLYTGERSFNIVGKRKIWYTISAVLILVSIIGPILKGGFNFGIEFTGGSEFVVSDVTDMSQTKATLAVQEVEPNMVPKVSTLGDSNIRVQTEQLTAEQNREIRVNLADAYAVPISNVTSSYIGASWGSDITTQAIRGLLVFLVLASLVMALYFRTWKMSFVAIVALVHDLVITAGIYGITGFEVTPGAVIGLLTILGYSLYDTVVVFDKIRENTQGSTKEASLTFANQVNLAVNQTLVRSINTSVVAALPVAAILFIGAFVLGAGTLRDISLALLIGIFVGTYSTIFLATPLYVQMRQNEPAIKKYDKKVLAEQSKTSA
ncbi:protein translocase subunit SecF [Aurantimicrobium sp. MWH-Uga1]|uniref:protein translocase subunit SecF n=1 Tax=Aurantimicrobium sp. MWH-Uga1 TaxID=2079575 RepID=UPI000DEE0C4E|nr:protein translocase subunit SecF [Aurantimicrobium sp. MWH-Uga1]AXE54568.1 preprotein translocase subunit SecF [Aurantimicrobium sp. MWH-Uga1]